MSKCSADHKNPYDNQGEANRSELDPQIWPTYTYKIPLPFREAGEGLQYALSDTMLSSIRRNFSNSGIILPSPNPVSSIKCEKRMEKGERRDRYSYIDDGCEINFDDILVDNDVKRVSTSKSPSDSWSRSMTKDDLKMITGLYRRLDGISISSSTYFEKMNSLKNYSTGIHLEEWPVVQLMIQRWILPWTTDSRSKLYGWICGYTDQSFISLYINRLHSIREELIVSDDVDRVNSLLSEAALTSGGIAFYGSIGVSLLETAKVCNVDHLFYFTSLYMLTDYWLDEPTADEKKKISTIRTLVDLIENPRRVHDSGALSIMTDRLVRLIEEIPGSYPVLKDAFYAEIVSAIIQKQSELPPEVYLKVCEWKGGAMLHSMQIICGSKPDKSGYLVGACIQLVDDMHDIDEDIAEGINTIATYIKSKYGNLDPLFFYTVHLMEDFDDKHTLFKPFILGMMMHSIAIIPHFSKELFEVCRPLFPFDRTYDLRGVIYDRMMRLFR